MHVQLLSDSTISLKVTHYILKLHITTKNFRTQYYYTISTASFHNNHCEQCMYHYQNVKPFWIMLQLEMMDVTVVTIKLLNACASHMHRAQGKSSPSPLAQQIITFIWTVKFRLHAGILLSPHHAAVQSSGYIHPVSCALHNTSTLLAPCHSKNLQLSVQDTPSHINFCQELKTFLFRSSISD